MNERIIPFILYHKKYCELKKINQQAYKPNN